MVGVIFSTWRSGTCLQTTPLMTWKKLVFLTGWPTDWITMNYWIPTLLDSNSYGKPLSTLCYQLQKHVDWCWGGYYREKKGWSPSLQCFWSHAKNNFDPKCKRQKWANIFHAPVLLPEHQWWCLIHRWTCHICMMQQPHLYLFKPSHHKKGPPQDY